jgi:4-hydroxy-tetrahydrodipicolinate reductase
MNATPVRVLIHGSTGRMGRALLRLCDEQPERFAVVAAVSRQPGQRVVDGVPQFGARELSGVPAFDVLVDFSQPEAFDRALALAVARKTGFVSGTTGLTDAQREALVEAAGQVPACWASNFSLGVAVLARLVRQAGQALAGWDCDIIETHHAGKVDAPSGTALTLGAAAGAGGAEPRYASLRAGDIVGEHVVQFTGIGERIELVHRATSRDIFARGALHAAARLPGREPGLYRVEDLLG